MLSQLTPLLADHQGKNTLDGALLDKNADTIQFGEYIFTIRHNYTLGWSPKAKEEHWPQTGGMVIQTAADEFIVAGTGIVITFSSDQENKGKVGILNIEEGDYNNGKWIPGRTMNGDQSHQGRHLRFPVDDFGIQKLKLYSYK